ncbi:MAG TPA: hypothetical protein VF145_11400 [Chitinophagaceae bacterium]
MKCIIKATPVTETKYNRRFSTVLLASRRCFKAECTNHTGTATRTK